MTTNEIKSYGQQWHLFLTTACSSTLKTPLAKALDIYEKAGKALQGWNEDVLQRNAYEFYRRFLPKLGTNGYTVIRAIVDARDEAGSAGYGCNPGFYGDINYVGNAW